MNTNRPPHKPKSAKNLPVMVATYDSSTDELSREPRLINYDSRREREWLTNHMTWALNAGHVVEVMSLATWKNFEQKVHTKDTAAIAAI